MIINLSEVINYSTKAVEYGRKNGMRMKSATG